MFGKTISGNMNGTETPDPNAADPNAASTATPAGISLDKSDPTIADMFSDCKPGDEITLDIGYNGKTVSVTGTVGADDDQTFSASITGVAPAAGDGDGADAETATDESGEGDSSPASYVRAKRGMKA